ncbi:MAG: hypothetical protein AB7O37_03895 [Vicinamibacteria bacterium]
MPERSMPPPEAFLPGRGLPLAYFGFAHLSLALALGTLALRPDSAAGFFYQPRTFALVHLVTLGFVSSAILGALYVVAPLAFRLSLPVGRRDWWAFWLFATGTLGMASHFWIDRPLGMLWAAPLPGLSLAFVSGRVALGLRAARVPWGPKLHLLLAALNVALAAALGFALGLNKVRPFAEIAPFAGVLAHAHLAAVGWGAMTVMGAGLRLFPMLLPAAMPAGRATAASAVVTQLGLLGLVGETLASGQASPAWSLVVAVGIGLFLAQVVFMLRRPRPAPAGRARPDPALGHVALALGCLLACLALGPWLSFAAADERSLALAKLYGVLGLVGFLTQLVVGVAIRILPTALWLRSFAEGGYRAQPPPVEELRDRKAGALTLALWILGLPPLAYGLFADIAPAVRPGAGLLLFATLVNAAHLALVARRARQLER